MAITNTQSARPMTDGKVPVGTDIRQKAFDASFVQSKIEQHERWEAEGEDFTADAAAWRLEHPNEGDPVQTHCVAVDPDNPTVKESLFVEVRIQVDHSATGNVIEQNSEWRQVSIINYPSINTGSYWERLKHIYDTEVTRMGLDPVA